MQNKVLEIILIGLLTVIGLTCFTVSAYAESNTEYLYVGHADTGMLSIIDTYSNLIINGSPITSNIQGLVSSPAGDYIIASDWYGHQVLFIQPVTNNILFKVPVSGNPYGLCASNDGKTVYVAIYWEENDDPGTHVAVIDVPSRTVSYLTLGHTASVNPRVVKLNPNGTRLYVMKENGTINWGTIETYDTATLSFIRTEGVPIGAADMAVSPDGEYVYTVSNANNYNSNGTVRVFWAANGTYKKDFFVPKFPFSIAFNKAQTGYYIGFENSGTSIVVKYDYPADTVNTVISIPNSAAADDYPFKVAVSNMGNLYVGHSSTISVYDGNTNAHITDLTPNHGQPGHMAFIIPSVESQYALTPQAYKIVVQSVYGLFKYNDVHVTVYDMDGTFKDSGYTDDTGAVTFVLSNSKKYTITAYDADENINRTTIISTNPYDTTIYFSVSFFLVDWNPFGWAQNAIDGWTGAGSGNVNNDIRMNYSVNTTSDPRVVMLNYTDYTASTTAINFTMLRFWQENGTSTVYNTTLVSGSGMTFQQMPISIPATEADGESYQIIVTGTTGAYGTVKRQDSYHFPGVAYPLPGLPASWYPYIAFGIIFMFGLFFTYLSSGLGLIVMSFWGIVFMFMGWLTWSNSFLLLLQVLAVFGVGQIFKMRKQREGV